MWKDKRKVAEYISERRRRYKRKLIELKGNKCEICGYSKCTSAPEFHHTKGKKDLKISLIYNRGWKRILKETEKTILVCANCHREIHSNTTNQMKLLTFEQRPGGRRFEKSKILPQAPLYNLHLSGYIQYLLK